MSEEKFRRGDRIQFQFIADTVYGVVKEDRGPIGIGGRRLYLIDFRMGPNSEEISQIELPAVKLKRAEESVIAN